MSAIVFTSLCVLCTVDTHLFVYPSLSKSLAFSICSLFLAICSMMICVRKATASEITNIAKSVAKSIPGTDAQCSE